MARLLHFDIQEFRKDLMCDPEFDAVFRQLEISKKPNTLIGLLQDGTYIEYSCVPRTFGITIQTKKIARDEAIEHYASQAE